LRSKLQEAEKTKKYKTIFDDSTIDNEVFTDHKTDSMEYSTKSKKGKEKISMVILEFVSEKISDTKKVKMKKERKTNLGTSVKSKERLVKNRQVSNIPIENSLTENLLFIPLSIKI